MVERTIYLDSLFSSLADPTRRDILSRVVEREFSVGELVACYDMSFAAISKHLKIMERAKLIVKRKEGKKQMISMAPDAFMGAEQYLEQYRKRWQSRYDKLDKLLQ